MTYAIVDSSNVITIIVITAEVAASRPDVIEVPDGTRTGQLWIEGEAVDLPAPVWPEISKDDFLERLTDAELLGFRNLAATNNTVATWRERILNQNMITRATIETGLNYLVHNGYLSVERQTELLT